MAPDSPAQSPRTSEDAPGDRPGRTHQSVKLREPLRRRLRLWAAFLDKEISELVEESVAARLDELDRDRAKRGLPALPDPDLGADGAPTTRSRARR